jgi:hypothetical protein
MLNVALHQPRAKWASLALQIQDIDQAVAAVGQKQNISQVQRAEVDTLPMQLIYKTGQRR